MKIEKHQELKEQHEWMCNIKTRVIPVVIEALGPITPKLEK